MRAVRSDERGREQGPLSRATRGMRAPVLTGDASTDRALLALARLLAEIATEGASADDREERQNPHPSGDCDPEVQKPVISIGRPDGPRDH